MNGHHIYVLNGKILAGSVPAAGGGVKKATKAQMAVHQETVSKGAGKNEKKTPTGKKGAVRPATVGAGTANNDTVRKPATTSKPSTKPAKAGKPVEGAKKDGVAKPQPKLVVDPVKPKKTPKPKAGVADVRTDGQINNKLSYDVGKEVFGSRKDLATLRDDLNSKIAKGVSVRGVLANLENVDPGAARKYCTKDNILQKYDWEAQHKQGVDLQAAMMKKLIFDRIQPKPELDNPETRRQYAYAIEELHRLLTPAKTIADLKGLRSTLRDRMRLETPQHLDDSQRYLDYAKKEAAKTPTEWDLKGADRKYNADGSVTRSDITAKEWKKRKDATVKEREATVAQWHENAKNPYHVLGDKLTAFFTDSDSYNRTADTIAKKKPTWEDYLSPQQREAKPKRNRKAEWERKVEDPFFRSGGRAGKVQKPEDAVKQFGLRGVQFGHWVDDTSGKFHLLKASEALQDMADVLGMKDNDVSLNGRLALAFGARGVGGSGAVAHYEPMLRVINLTKMGGAGSLAHEWGHAMDDILGDHSGIAEYASENHEQLKNPEIRVAYTELMNAIEQGDGTHKGTTTVVNDNKPRGRYYPSYQKAVRERGLAPEVISHFAKQINDRYDAEKDRLERYVASSGSEAAKKKLKTLESGRKREINSMHQELMYHHQKHTQTTVESMEVPTSGSEYLNRMKELDGERSKPYYSTGREMFARVFESWMQQNLNDKGTKNNYLVSGTSEKYMDAVDAHNVKNGMDNPTPPFPRGSERKDMFAKMGKLLKAIVGTGEIKKALEFDLQKSSVTDYLLDMFVPPHRQEEVKAALSGETKRYAYEISHTVDPSEVLYIPVNRLHMIYQTDAATNWDKVKENMNRMQAGEALEPVVIGYDYDIHDGHHRWMAAKALDHTHVPCVIGGTDDLRKIIAMEHYRELWKSVGKTGELEGGAWRTMNGHHVYVKGGKIVAGGQEWMHGKNSTEVRKEGAGNDGKEGREAGVKGQAGSGGQGAVAKRDGELQKTDDKASAIVDKIHGLDKVPEQYHDAIKDYLSEHEDDAKGVLDGNLSKGRCDTVSSAIVDKLKEKGIHARLAEGQGLKTGLDDGAHGDWKDFAKDPKDLKFMGHTVIQTPDGIIDVTGSQFGKKYGGIRFISNDDFKKEWTSGKVNYTKNQRDDADMDTSDRFSKLAPMKAPKKLQKSVITDPTNEPGSGGLPDDPNTMYRGIGQKELDAIYAKGFIQTKGKGNDDDKGKRTTCFTNLFEQAEGYARTQYSQYGETAAYVIALPKPPWVYEDEHGEILSDAPVPFAVGVVIPIDNPAREHDAVVDPSPGVELLVEHNYL